MHADSTPGHKAAKPSLLSMVLAIAVVASIVLIALVVGAALLPNPGFEIPEPNLPIYDWPDLAA